MAESGSGNELCSEGGNCLQDRGILNELTLLVIIIASAVFVIILIIFIVCCMIGVSRYLIRKRQKLHNDLKNDHDGYLFDKPVVKCTKIEMQSRHFSMLETASEIFGSNTMRSGVNSNPPSSPPLLLIAQPTEEIASTNRVTSFVCTDSTVTNDSQHLPVLRQLSVPLRKRPRNNYDQLMSVSTANRPTPLTSKEDTTIHSDKGKTLEGVSSNNSTVRCNKIEIQSCMIETSEFSSGVNRNPPSSPPPLLVAQPTEETALTNRVTSFVCTNSTVTNDSQHLPVLRQLSVPLRKRPQDNYDQLISVSTANNSTPLTFEVESDKRMTLEGVSSDKPAVKCTKTEYIAACRFSMIETSEFSSGVNSNPPSSPPPLLVAQPTEEIASTNRVTSFVCTNSTNTNDSQRLPVLRQLSVPLTKRPRDNYDQLISVSRPNEPTPLKTEEDTVNEKEEVQGDSVRVSAPASAVCRQQSLRVVTDTVETSATQDLSHASVNTIQSALATKTTSEPVHVNISDNTVIPEQDSRSHIRIDDSVKPKKVHTTSEQTDSGGQYSYTTQHSLHSSKHEPVDNGVIIDHQFDFIPQADNACRLQKSASLKGVNSHLMILSDVKMTRWQSCPDVYACALPSSQPQDHNEIIASAAHDNTYYNLPQVSDSTQHEPAASRPLQVVSGLERNKKVSVSVSAVQPKSAATNKEPLYTTLICREVHYHEYDKPSPMHSHKCHQNSPPKPRIARQPKQIISNSTSRMDYGNISVWLSSKKKPPPQAAESSTLPSGYTPLLHSTMTKKSNYENTFRQEQSTAVIVRTQTLV